MKYDVPDPDEMKDLIRVKIDIEGLTEEDIAFLRNQSDRIMSERTGVRI